MKCSFPPVGKFPPIFLTPNKISAILMSKWANMQGLGQGSEFRTVQNFPKYCMLKMALFNPKNALLEESLYTHPTIVKSLILNSMWLSKTDKQPMSVRVSLFSCHYETDDSHHLHHDLKRAPLPSEGVRLGNKSSEMSHQKTYYLCN